ncbi:MAG TPA: hypothetical protein VK912_02165 [Longimicrobiales bacterium]|nr:hypothetical protein [Longimicrobiales bacterium]
MKLNGVVPVVVLLIGAGCDMTQAATAEQEGGVGIVSAMQGDSARRAPAPVADSILPMATMIARFQADLPAVASLGDDAPRSVDELIARFVEAVEDSSTDALAALMLSRAEFAHLYFPSSAHAQPPYAQPPAVNWLLLEQNSLKGQSRLLRRFGGKRLPVASHHCAGAPVIQGANRIHQTCTLRISSADGWTEDVRLFGSIVERDGRFKLLSLSNRL